MINTPKSLLLIAALAICGLSSQAQTGPTVKTKLGTIEGIGDTSGIKKFLGVPYAQPPIDDLRWKAPQPVHAWKNTLKATHFGPRAMQRALYADQVFRSNKISEDCLYLNVWSPNLKPGTKLPVLVYFYGGGFNTGDGSEPRYDGESMARKGIVVVTVNYRLGIFGFLSHPQLTAESPVHSSGNYGLLDQHAALEWVHQYINSFGGDPSQITIAGESAGAASVCAQMATPLSKGLFVRAIAESGSNFVLDGVASLSKGEDNGVKLMKAAGAGSIADMRKIPADQLMQLTAQPDLGHFPIVVDGYFFPKSPIEIFTHGLQMDVPLLAGWNSAEVNYHSLLGKAEPTPENYATAVKQLYGDRADEILAAYHADNHAEVKQVATDLASDRFIVYATWKFIFLHSITNGHPVYRYYFTHKLPDKTNPDANEEALLGAPHASEIQYAMGNLRLNSDYAWTADDYRTSSTMQAFFANFIKTGNPNGPALPHWFGLQSSIPKVMVIDTESQSIGEKNLKRYILLDTFYYNKN